MLGAVIGLAPLGCSLLLDDGFDGFTEPRSADAGQLDPNPTREGTTGLDSDPIDAATSVGDAAEVEADAAPDPNLLANPDFESPDCGGWLTEFAVASHIALPHSGARGCLVCSVPGNEEAQLYQVIPMPVPKGAAYLGQLWVRGAPGEAAPKPATVGLEVDVRSDGSLLQRGAVAYAAEPFPSEWVRINAAITTANSDEAVAVQLFLHFPAMTRTCVVVDTARLVMAAN